MDRLKFPNRSRTRPYSAEAERKFRSFFRGFGIEDDAAMKELIRRLGRLAPSGAAGDIDAAAGRWFADVLGRPESEAARALAAGRVAWLVAQAGRRWPLTLLSDTPPLAVTEALRRGLPALPPPLLGDPMPAAELERRRLPSFAARPLRARTA